MKIAVTILAGLAGIMGLIATIIAAWDTSLKWAVIGFGTVGILLVIGQIYIDIWGRSRNFRRFRNQDRPEGRRAVKIYMDELLSKGENVAIFTRDMSWVDDDTEILLRQKAIGNNLTIFMLQANEISKKLHEDGARIFYYGEITGDRAIMSRFTLINMGRSQPELAIGHRNADVHTIELFSDSKDYALTLAQDMFALLTASFKNLGTSESGYLTSGSRGESLDSQVSNFPGR